MPASTTPPQAIEACSADERMPDSSHADQDSARPALKRARSSYSRKDRSNGVHDKAATSHADTSPTVAAAAAMDGVEIFSLKHYSQDTLDYPRRRATIACEICRSRKSRCDGTRPKCRLCAELGADCVYREPGIKLDAGDKLILAQLERIEGMLQSSLHSPINGFAGSVSPATSHTASDDLQARKMNGVTSNDFAGGPMPLNGLGTWSANISTIPPHHTTPALHLLQWPVIRDLITRQCDPGVLVRLEMAREPMSFSRHLSVDFTNMSLYTQAFFDKVNVWYAVVNPYTWTQYTQIAATFSFQAGAESCVVLLVMALGEAAHSGISISRLPHGSIPPGMSFFAAAWRILPSLMIKNDVSSAQCHILAAAYLMYLVRPLEAWNLLCNASMKQQLLLSSPHAIPSQLRELNERIFWNALMIESDLLAELDLPQSGIAQLEESMRLPRSFPYDVTSSSADLFGGDDLWYFLAEIALRRLLNRVSHLVYTRKRSAPFTVGSLDPIVAELDFQLDQWYQNLPSSVKFPKDRLPINNQVQTVLRLRYYACRTIIYRPYIQAVLYDESQAAEASVQDACRKCLEACIRQLEFVTAHHEGHLPYLWQGALSIMSQSLIIMAATLSGALKVLLPPPHQMDAIIAEVVDEVARLAHLAPSLELCAEIVREAQERRLSILAGMNR